MSDVAPTVGRRINDAITMFVVLFVSLLLLVYVAFGEAKRTFEGFQGDKLHGQVLVVQNSMQTPLRSGLALKQFVGFKTLTDPIFSSDNSVGTLTAYDLTGDVVFSAGDVAIIRNLPKPFEIVSPVRTIESSVASGAQRASKTEQRKRYILARQNGHYRIVVPLRNKFETVGYLGITMPESVVENRVREAFQPLFYASIIPALIFALLIGIFGPRMARSRVPWAQISFGIVFLTASAGVIATLIALYSDGAQAKARALAGSLGQRLSDVVAFNININEIQGLDRTFGEYLNVNPDISAASLTVDGRIVIHTDRTRVGERWIGSADHYEYVVDLKSPLSDREVQVAVELPGGVVLEQIARSVKNFAALFIASAFLASLFFQLGGAVRRPMSSKSGRADGKGVSANDPPTETSNEWMLDHLKPVFFLGVLLEHLTYAFLPQFVQAAVTSAGVSPSFASAPFVGFYLFFALTLIPAGYAAQRIGPKLLMSLGLVLAGAGLASLAFYPEFITILMARCLSGIGQGMLFIGVQSYLLAVAPPGKKTQAAGIIVYGFQGGMISGMAVGSLLVSYMGPDGVFMLAAAIGVIASAYAVVAVPSIPAEAVNRAPTVPAQGLMVSVGHAIRNFNFMNTMITIGVPAKAVLTGVMTFALPLLLAQSGYPQEDIGQIIMIYAISVVLSSGLISSYVDGIGNARNVLFQGAVLSGVGLLLIGVSGGLDTAAETAGYVSTGLLVIGVALLGIAHGFINAPVVTFIADSDLADRIGQSTATATYRFLERIGHVAGPVVVGQLLIWTAYDWNTISVVGLVIAMFAFIFILTAENTPKRTVRSPEADDARLDRATNRNRPASA
ncbi:MAG: MFS transporter [Pseudomonadota bacterium]